MARVKLFDGKPSVSMQPFKLQDVDYWRPLLSVPVSNLALKGGLLKVLPLWIGACFGFCPIFSALARLVCIGR